MINRKTCGFKLRQLEKIVESSKIQTLVLMLEKNSVLEIHIQNQMPLIIFHIQVKQEQQPNQSKKKVRLRQILFNTTSDKRSAVQLIKIKKA